MRRRVANEPFEAGISAFRLGRNAARDRGRQAAAPEAPLESQPDADLEVALLGRRTPPGAAGEDVEARRAERRGRGAPGQVVGGRRAQWRRQRERGLISQVMEVAVDDQGDRFGQRRAVAVAPLGDRQVAIQARLASLVGHLDAQRARSRPSRNRQTQHAGGRRVVPRHDHRRDARHQRIGDLPRRRTTLVGTGGGGDHHRVGRNEQHRRIMEQNHSSA